MYKQALDDIYSILSSSAWTDLSLETLPQGYEGDISNTDEYIYVNVIFGESSLLTYNGQKEVSGTIIFTVYTPSTANQSRPLEIADLIDSVFQKKRISSIETGVSFIIQQGKDPVDGNMMRTQYNLPFAYYGD